MFVLADSWGVIEYRSDSHDVAMPWTRRGEAATSGRRRASARSKTTFMLKSPIVLEVASELKLGRLKIGLARATPSRISWRLWVGKTYGTRVNTGHFEIVKAAVLKKSAV